MYRIIPLGIIILFFVTSTSAQNPVEWEELEFKRLEDYKSYEPKVLECANFVLTVAADAADPVRRTALNVISRWMAGTPDYSFSIDEPVARLMKKNEAVLSIYMAAATKFVLENPSQATNAATVAYHAIDLLLTYCEDSTHDVEETKALKKAIQAKNKGNLEKYLSQ